MGVSRLPIIARKVTNVRARTTPTVLQAKEHEWNKSMQRPSLPTRLRKQKGEEKLMVLAFLLPHNRHIPSEIVKATYCPRGRCGFDNLGPAWRELQVAGYIEPF